MKKDSGLILYDTVFKYELTMTQRFIFSFILYYYKKKNINRIDENLISIIINKLNVNKKTVKNTLNILSKKGLLDDNYNLKISIFNNDKSNYIYIPHDILNNNDLTDIDKAILSYLYSFIRKNKHCKISNNVIADKLFISKRTVEKSIIKLKKLGFIKTSFETRGFVTKNREIYINEENLHNLYIKHVEKIEKVKKVEKIEKVERLDTIDKVEEIKSGSIENVEKINKVDNINLNIFELNDLSDLLTSIKLSKEDAQKLYFRKKKEFELIKELYNNSIKNE